MTHEEIDAAITENDPDRLIEALKDKTLPIETVEKIYRIYRDHKEVVGQAAMNLSLRTSVYDRDQEYSATMVALLRDMADNPVDMGARWAVAKNPHTPPEVLEALAADEVNLVRALTATNPATPPHALEKLFHDEPRIREGLTGNPSTPPKLLALMAADTDRLIRIRLCENPSLPTETLKMLQNDTDPDVAKAAEVNLKGRE